MPRNLFLIIIVLSLSALIIAVTANAADSTVIVKINRDKSKSLISPLIAGTKPSVKTDKIESSYFTSDEKEYICGIETSDESMEKDSLSIWFSVKENNIWQIPEAVKVAKYTNKDVPAKSHFCKGPEIVRIAGALYVLLSYENFAVDKNSVEHIEVLFDLSNSNTTYGIFSGRKMNGKKLEGRLTAFGGDESTETVKKFITDRFNVNDNLMTITSADAMSDELMEKWISINGSASEDAGHIVFIPIPEESSISKVYDNRKFGKETGDGHSAVLMNFRDNTIICSSDKNGKKTLVWCERQCTDRTSEKYLHTIFFEQKSTITLFYYYGRKSFKYRINLENGKITR